MNHSKDLKNLEDRELIKYYFPGSFTSKMLNDILFLDFFNEIEFLISFVSSFFELVILVFLTFHCRWSSIPSETLPRFAA